MNHEDYVSFEQAKKLKELGFDWECRGCYDADRPNSEEVDDKIKEATDFNACRDFEGLFSAPTLAQAAKWLREKGIVIIVDYFHYDNFEQSYYFDIKRVINDRVTVGVETDTYEQALSAGIDKGLELLKEQSNG